MSAKSGRFRSMFRPRLSMPSSWVMTQELEPSDPAAGSVGMTPCGAAAAGVALPQKKSQKSPA